MRYATAEDVCSQVWGVRNAELDMLGRQLLDADRIVHEQLLGWAWNPPLVSPSAQVGTACMQPKLQQGQLE